MSMLVVFASSGRNCGVGFRFPHPVDGLVLGDLEEERVERAVARLVVFVERHDIHEIDERFLYGLLGVFVGDPVLRQRPFDHQRIVMVEPRPAVLVALGKSFQKRICSFKHGILQQLTEECAGWYGDRLIV